MKLKLVLFFCVGIMLVLSLGSCSGGGGGDGGDRGGGQSDTIEINEFGNTNVSPLSKLTVTGTGFDPQSNLTVNFFDNNDFSIDVPVLEATTSSVIVAVPPYINISTGNFEAGTVSVRVLQNSAGGNLISNTITGLQIDSLPAITLPPGEVTANVAAFLELSLTGTINRIAELDRLPDNQFDTQNLRTQLEAIRLQYRQLKEKVRDAIANPDQAETIATINGVSISLDEESLRVADQLMVAVINEILAQLQYPSSASQQSEDISVRSNCAAAMAFSSICVNNPELCSTAGQPLITVKNYRTGEETAVTQYHYAMALPGASEVLGDFMDFFAKTTATIGAVAFASGVTIPIAAVAAITQVNVTCMSAKFGLDSARLTANSNDKEAAKDLLNDFNGTLEYMHDSVVSPAISAMSEKAGVAYDLLTSWKPVMALQIPEFVSQFESFLDTSTPTGNVTGSWYGTISNPYLRTGCEGGNSYFSVTLTEDALMNITGSYGSVGFSGSRIGNTIMVTANTRFGNRSYTWTWDGSDTITGSIAYYCWSNDTGALLSEGSGAFSVTLY